MPDYPRSFMAAVRARFLADAWLMARLPGGIWHQQVPPGNPNPSAVYFVVEGSNHQERIDNRNFIETGQIQITIYAADPHVSEKLATVAASDLVTNLSMSWDNGNLMYFGLAQPTQPPDFTPGYGGTNIQEGTRIIDYQFHGGY